MKREWMLWSGKRVILVYLAIFVLFTAVMGLFGYARYANWWRWNGLMEMHSSTSSVKQEIHTVFIRSMISGFVYQKINLVILTLLVVLSFGREVWKRRLPLMVQLQMSLPKKYLEAFLMNVALAFALSLEGFLIQLARIHSLCGEYLSEADSLFFARILLYLVLVTLCLTAIVQLVALVLSRLHWCIPLLLSVPGILVLWGSSLPKRIQAYLCWDMPSEVWQEQYVPVIADAEAVHRWGCFFLAGLVGVTVLCLAVGVVWLQVRYKARQVKTDKKGLSLTSLNVTEGETCILAGWDREHVHALFSALADSMQPDGGKMYLTGEPFYYGRLDVRGNLYAIRSLQKKALTATPEEIEELLGMVGLGGIGGRGRSLQSYSEGMKCCYGIVSALLIKPKVLVLEGILDEMGEADARMVQEAVLRLRETGLTLLLSTSDREAEKNWKWIGQGVRWISMT